MNIALLFYGQPRFIGHPEIYQSYKQNIIDKYNVDIFLGIGGGPEGVLAASALDTFDCFFQGKFFFETTEDKKRANDMGIKNLDKKYEINEIVSGDSIFCATGITSGDIVSGINLKNNFSYYHLQIYFLFHICHCLVFYFLNH